MYMYLRWIYSNIESEWQELQVPYTQITHVAMTLQMQIDWRIWTTAWQEQSSLETGLLQQPL